MKRYYINGRSQRNGRMDCIMYLAKDFQDAETQAKKDFWFVDRIRHYPHGEQREPYALPKEKTEKPSE